MKRSRTEVITTFFAMFAACFFVAASSCAATLEISPELRSATLDVIPDAMANNTAIQHCGCDKKEGVEMYVQNLIDDAKKRGLDCQASYHIPACITTYCSICKGHEGLVENCIQTGIEYFARSAASCSQQANGMAFAMPSISFLSQIQQ
jgi:hypothetical protein